MAEDNFKKESENKSGGGCLGTILFIVIIFFVIRSCSGGSDDENEEPDTNEPVQESVTDEEDSITEGTSGTENIHDEAVLAVNSFIKAEVDGDVETALTYCTDSVTDEVRKSIEERNKAKDDLYSECMDTYVGAAQYVLNSYGDSSDIISVDFLYDDSDMKEVCAEMVECVNRNSRIYSLPEKAEMLSDTEAVVAVDFKGKYPKETETSLLDYAKDYLSDIVLKKLRNDSNFIKDMIAKKVVKESTIDLVKEYISQYEASDEMSTGKTTYYLTKQNGKWLIKKMNLVDYSNQNYGDKETEENHNEDGYGEETYGSMEEDIGNDDYENMEEDVGEDDYASMEEDAGGDDYEDEMITEYILPYSSEEYLSEYDVENLSGEECRIARNEIYARHGRRFNDEQLQAYFDACSWYEGTIDPEDFSDDMLNEVEKANLEMIAEYESRMGY